MKKEIQITGKFTFNLLSDGRHVNMMLEFDSNPPEIQAWMDFAYCNDLVWRIHARRGDNTEVWMSMIRMELYRHLFRHIHGEQYLVAE